MWYHIIRTEIWRKNTKYWWCLIYRGVYNLYIMILEKEWEESDGEDLMYHRNMKEEKGSNRKKIQNSFFLRLLPNLKIRGPITMNSSILGEKKTTFCVVKIPNYLCFTCFFFYKEYLYNFFSLSFYFLHNQSKENIYIFFIFSPTK